MTDNKTKKQHKQYIDKNPIEAVKDLTGGVASTFVNDVLKESTSDLWNQILGAKKNEKKDNSGDLREGEEIDFSNAQKETLVEAGIDYRREIVHAQARITGENNREIEVKVHEIIIELKQLVAQSKELQAQFKEIAIEQMPVKPGDYHLSFFSFVVLEIRKARMKIENSASWLALFKSKKNKKQYWSMFKKHGTTFGLSNERVLATQTG